MKVIRVHTVSKSFGKLCAVNDLSFEVEEGTCFGLLGPNGAGKTTMMKMIYGRSSRDDHDGGIIDVLGYDPARDELAIKYLSWCQENNLDDELNVIQNLMIYPFYGLPSKVAGADRRLLSSWSWRRSAADQRASAACNAAGHRRRAE
jgi:lipooligosaccharide transport system ATP-binding protein